jgi:hypothetical protein
MNGLSLSLSLRSMHKCEFRGECLSRQRVKKGNDLMELVNTTRVSPTVCCNLRTADARNLDPPNAGNAP